MYPFSETDAMNLLRTLLAAALLAALAPAGLHSQDKDGWVTLLPVEELSKNWTTAGNWVHDKEGFVELQPRKGESGWTRYNMYLWANNTYTDFEIEFDYKVAKGGNSGFYFRVGDKKEPVKTGIEVQIYDSGSKKPGAKLNDHDSGGIIPGVAPTKNAAKPAGEWNRFNIVNKGDKLVVKLNDEIVNEVDLSKGALSKRPKTGAIGFQDHGLPLWIRNVKIRELK